MNPRMCDGLDYYNSSHSIHKTIFVWLLCSLFWFVIVQVNFERPSSIWEDASEMRRLLTFGDSCALLRSSRRLASAVVSRAIEVVTDAAPAVFRPPGVLQPRGVNDKVVLGRS